MARKPRPIEERFWAKVGRVNSESCLEWMGNTFPNGYGQLYVRREDGREGKELAHRRSWIIENGPIPDGFQVLHECDNPPCVNPNHLFLGTTTDNMRDKVAKGRNREGPVIGQQNPNAKLTEADVLKIRELAITMPRKEIQQRYGLVHSHLSAIVNRKQWKHI